MRPIFAMSVPNSLNALIERRFALAGFRANLIETAQISFIEMRHERVRCAAAENTSVVCAAAKSGFTRHRRSLAKV